MPKKLKTKNLNQKAPDKRWQFHIYIAGRTLHGMNAINNLKVFCKKYLSGNYHIKVIDIMIHPEEAELHNIIAIPTIFKIKPEPVQIFIGDFSDTEIMIMKLSLNPLSITTR